MTDGLPDPPALDPAELAGRSFARTRKGKGFDPTEVRATLGLAADALRVWKERDERLGAQVRELQTALSSADELSDERLAHLLGAESVRVIRTAQDAAAEIRRRAEDAAAAARAEAELARTETEQLRREALSAAEAELVSARQRGRDMVAEAREVRERMLRDLAERRRVARQQIEAARAGRDRIVDALRSAGGAVEGLAGLLGELDQEIQEVSDRAAAEVTDDIGEVVAAVRAELDRSEAVAGEASGDVAAPSDPPVPVEAGPDAAAADGPVVVYDDVVVEFAPPAGRSSSTLGASSDDDDIDIDDDIDDELDDIDDELDDIDDELDLDDDDLDDLHLDDVDDDLDDDGAEEHPGAVAPRPGAADAPADGSVTELAAARRTVGTDAEVISFPVVHRRGRDDTGADHEGPDHEGPDDTDPDDTDPQDTGPTDESFVEEVPGGTVADHASTPEERTGPDPGDEVAGIFERIRSATVLDAPAPVPPPPAAATEPPPAAPAEVGVAVAEGSPDPVDADEAARDARDAALAGPAQDLARALKRIVADEQNEVLDRLRRTRSQSRPTVEDLVGTEEADLDLYLTGLQPHLMAVASAGAALWSASGGAVGRLPSEPAAVVGLVGPVLAEALRLRRSRLATTLGGAAADGADRDDLGGRLRAAYREWRSTSVDGLAGDLVTASAAAGVRVGAPDGAPCRWVADHDGLPCADAEDNALAGCTSLGSPFPTGDVLPPAHAGCRCLLVPEPSAADRQDS